jgi:hypothetical protein
VVSWSFDKVTWDGQALVVLATTESGQVVCRVPRNTIHVLRLYSDAIGREIHLERQRIAEKLPISSCEIVAGHQRRIRGVISLGSPRLTRKRSLVEGCRTFGKALVTRICVK